MAEKNIAALIRNDTFTIGVRFYNTEWKGQQAPSAFDPSDIGSMPVDTLSNKEYTYVASRQLNAGDVVVVMARGFPQVAYVSRVDTDLCIEPNQEVKYGWVVDYINIAGYEEELEKNKAIEQTVNSAYKANIKRQFRDVVLSQIDADSALKLSNLLGEQKQS